MRVTPPMTITTAMLATSLAEPGPGESAWVGATNYATGSLVIRTAMHRKYERLAPGGVDATAPESAPTLWRYAGPTNAWAMFDLERNTQSEASAASIVATLTPGRRVTSIGLVGLYGSSATIEMHSGVTLIYTTTINLLLRSTTTWRQYFYGAFRVRKAFVLYDMPMDAAATVTITVTPYAGFARCGGVVLGTEEYMGYIVDEPTSDVVNFSKITRDDFGNATLVKRRNVPTNAHRLISPVTSLNRLTELRDELDAVPALWSGADDQNDSSFFDTLLVLGIAKKFTISMNGPDLLRVDLQLEEI